MIYPPWTTGCIRLLDDWAGARGVLLLLLLLVVAGPEKLWGGSHSVWRDGAHTPSPLLLFALHHYSRVPLSAQGVLAHGGLKDEWRSGGGEVYFFLALIIF
jgi:hypothetical protein